MAQIQIDSSGVVVAVFMVPQIEINGLVDVADDDPQVVAFEASQLGVLVRQDRNARLAACDWTQSRDIPDSVAAKWGPYRQALRDVTEQTTFPQSVEWPVFP